MKNAKIEIKGQLDRILVKIRLESCLLHHLWVDVVLDWARLPTLGPRKPFWRAMTMWAETFQVCVIRE
jgi:hypothetical protein